MFLKCSYLAPATLRGGDGPMKLLSVLNSAASIPVFRLVHPNPVSCPSLSKDISRKFSVQ